MSRWKQWWPGEWEAFHARRSLRLQPPTRPSGLQIAIWLIATAISAGLIFSNFNSFQLGAYDDDAEYAVLARSIVETGQFGAIYNPGKPGESIFPFGFPLLLAPLVWAFPGNYNALKAVSLAATLLNIGLIFWGWPWLSWSTSRWWGVAVMVCYSLSPLAINHARMVMSEPVFTTCCLAAYILTEQISRDRASYKWIILLGVTLLALCAIRSVGLVLAAGLILDLFMTLRQLALKSVLATLAAVAVAATLLVMVTPIKTGDIFFPVQRYAGDFFNFARNQDGAAQSRPSTPPFPLRIMQRAYVHFVRELRSAVFALGGGDREHAFFASLGLSFLQDSVGLIVGVLVITGILRGFWREGGSAFFTVTLVYLGSLLLWNWNGDRFAYPILPQLLLGLFLGVDGLMRWAAPLVPLTIDRRIHGVGILAAVFVVLSSFIYRTLHIEPSSLHTGDLTVRTEWLRANTEPDAVIMTEEPAADFIYGERHTVSTFRVSASTAADNLDVLAAYLASNQVDYVLVAPGLEWQEVYAPVYSDNMVRLLAEIESLEARGLVSLVYESVDDAIKVYRVEY